MNEGETPPFKWEEVFADEQASFEEFTKSLDRARRHATNTVTNEGDDK
jgi:hypothetical protein